MKCPNCGAAKLVHDTRDVPYTCKGESTILRQITGGFCPACDESIRDASESRRTMELMLAAGRGEGSMTAMSKPLRAAIQQDDDQLDSGAGAEISNR